MGPFKQSLDVTKMSVPGFKEYFSEVQLLNTYLRLTTAVNSPVNGYSLNRIIVAVVVINYSF
jgi:hypothetical protein